MPSSLRVTKTACAANELIDLGRRCFDLGVAVAGLLVAAASSVRFGVISVAPL